MSNRINRKDLDLLLSAGKKLSRHDIMEMIGVSETDARAYKGIVDNWDLLESGDAKSDDVRTYVVSGCWHVPFHNKTLYTGFKMLLNDINPDGFVLAGDFIDAGSLSEYERGKMSHTGVTLEDEYNAANVILDEIDYLLGKNTEKIYLWGNHCGRYHRWKADVNNGKYGDLLNPTKGMKLIERGYSVYEDYQNDFIELGSLQVFHGIFYNVHVAKKTLDSLRRNTMFVHTHREQMYREGEFASWNIGFMADVNAPCFSYAPRTMRNAWANSFALVHVTSKEFFVEPINVVNSHFIYGGKKY